MRQARLGWSRMITCLRVFTLVLCAAFGRGGYADLHAGEEIADQLTNRPETLTHPMLLFDRSEIDELRKQASTSHASIVNRLQARLRNHTSSYTPPDTEEKFGAVWNEHFSLGLIPRAFMTVLEPENDRMQEEVLGSLRQMMTFKSWNVAGLKDEVPLAHHLLAVSLAYDMLYDSLQETERTAIADRILQETTHLMKLASKKAGWSRQYVHNHMPTVLTAFLTGALVIQDHAPEASRRQQDIVNVLMQRNVQLMRHITDGSFHEGVHYSLYTSRSLMLYIHLMKRHQATSYYDHPWLREYLTFLTATTLPGYAGPSGTADASIDYQYGPIAQLYFLDKYVLRTGEANWLARRIQERMDTGKAASKPTALIQMMPFEFLFYDPSVGEREPQQLLKSPLVTLPDWGFASYGGGTSMGHTYLSLKCGPIFGRSLYDISRNLTHPQFPFLNKRGIFTSFNAGHEHPDRGAFVFYPNGKPFITESFYAVKNSYLDNVWSFEIAPGRSNGDRQHQYVMCAGGNLVGQLGACKGKWLDYRYGASRDSTSSIIMAEERDGLVVLMSDSTTAYPPSLGVLRNTRTLLLLDSGNLLVIDSIVLGADSIVQAGNAFFHNLFEAFQVHANTGSVFASLGSWDAARMQWFVGHGYKSTATTGSTYFPQFKGKRGTVEGHYLNVSIPLMDGSNTVAWLIQADRRDGDTVEFVRQSKHAVELGLRVGDVAYTASVVTNHTYLSHRYNWHGSGLLVHVVKDGILTRFGGREFASTYTSSSGNDTPDLDLPLHMISKPRETEIQVCYIMLYFAMLVGLFMVPVSGCAFRRTLSLQQCPVKAIVLSWVILLCLVFATINPSCDGNNHDLAAAAVNRENPRDGVQSTLFSPASTSSTSTVQGSTESGRPQVLLTGLFPGAAARNAVQRMFRKSPDVVLKSLSLKPGSESSCSTLVSYPQSWYWPNGTACSGQPAAKSAFIEFFKSAHSCMFGAEGQSTLADDPTALVIAVDYKGVWMPKLDWFLGVDESRLAIIVVDDPVRWVANVLKTKHLETEHGAPLYLDHLKELVTAPALQCSAEAMLGACYKTHTMWTNLLTIELSRPSASKTARHKLLATYWAAYMSTVLCLAKRWGPRRVQVLPLHTFALTAGRDAARLYRLLRLPHRPNVQNDLNLMTRSGLAQFQKTMSYLTGKSAGSTLRLSMRHDIETICSSVLQELQQYTV
eukprot:scpid21886/ scgid10239/ Dermatan-sulfate epimerase; Chondroitin-glucuronate 5-epimerase; Squamous cell carcinoma antigen recognized by T-cells 2